MQIELKSFLLDPEAPMESEESMAEHLAHKYGMSLKEAEQQNARVEQSMRALDLPADFAAIRRTNTQPAHRLLQFAKSRDLGKSVYDLIQRGYYAEGALISDTETLIGLAAKAGLDPGEARVALTDPAWAEAVRFDVDEARRLGIHSVPFFVFDRAMAVAGAHPAETLLGALEKAAQYATEDRI